MTDSIAVFPPGFRLTDNTDASVMSGAILYFYDAGTTNPKTVYSDSALSVSLGTSVTCDALGYPTSDGSAKTQVYVGTTAYKIIIKTSAGVTIATHDNIPGAVATVTPEDTSVTATRPVVTKSINYTVVAPTDQNTIFAGNCSSGDVTFTLPSAVTAATGWAITVQHAGSANQCVISTVSSQTISEGSKSFGTSYVLTLNGEEATFVSDGGNWRVVSHTSPFLQNGEAVLTVISRTNTPPGSPGQGDMYIVTASPTGAWSGFAAGDIAKYTGAAWINFTPPSNVGWLTWVQAESLHYRYAGSAWENPYATTAETETGTSITKSITPADTNGYIPGALLGLIEDRKTSGTAPQTTTGSAWTKRDLNTETYDRLGTLSVASNQFTISQAGTYEITWETPGHSSSGYMSSRLYNATDAAAVDYGTQAGWGSGTGATAFLSAGVARVTIAGSKTFEIQYFATSASLDLGRAATIASKSEIYTRVIIRRG